MFDLPTSKLETLEIQSRDFLNFFRPKIMSKVLGFEASFSFPSLTTLVLNGSGCWTPEDYSSLPPTLTILGNNMAEYWDGADHAIMSSLPRGLLQWHTSITVSSENDSETCPIFWQNPPPHLHTLETIIFNSSDVGNFATYLPRSLTNCIIKDIQIDDVASFVSQLPSGIRNLGIEELTKSSS